MPDGQVSGFDHYHYGGNTVELTVTAAPDAGIVTTGWADEEGSGYVGKVHCVDADGKTQWFDEIADNFTDDGPYREIVPLVPRVTRSATVLGLSGLTSPSIIVARPGDGPRGEPD